MLRHTYAPVILQNVRIVMKHGHLLWWENKTRGYTYQKLEGT